MSIKYSDSGFLDGADETKKLSFDVSGVTTGTTRTITMPDGDTKLYTGDGTSGQILTSGGAGVAPTFQAAAGGGKVLQVLQDVLDTELSVTLNTTWGAITGLSKAITPSATSSTVLVQVVVNVGGQSSGGESYPKIRLKRGSTSIGVGSGSGSRTLSSAMWSPGSTSINCTGTLTITFLDSPNTTSATTYSVDIFAYNNRSFYINRVSADENTAGGRAISTITLTEVSV